MLANVRAAPIRMPPSSLVLTATGPGLPAADAQILPEARSHGDCGREPTRTSCWALVKYDACAEAEVVRSRSAVCRRCS